MADNTDYKREIFEKAVVLANLIEDNADNEIIGLTVKLLAIDYLQFCKQVGMNPVNPMSAEKVGLDATTAEGPLN